MTNNTISSDFLMGTDSASNFFIRGSQDQPAFGIDAEGRIKLPYQPFFSAYLLNKVYDQTGANKRSAFIADGIIKNIGGHYNASSGQFKAPISGSYHFDCCITASDIADSITYGSLWFKVGQNEFRQAYANPGAIKDNFNTASYQTSMSQYMEAGQIAQVFLVMNGGAENTVDFVGAINNIVYSYFSGYLIG